MNTFDAYFTGLRGRKIAVMGLGVSNRPLVRLLLHYGCDVTGCDRTPREKVDQEVLELEQLGCTLRLGDTYLENVTADLVFRTPGMHPANPALEQLRSAGAKITSEMEVFFELCPCTVIAVTGSDGKTTTTTLIAEMLKAAGKTVWLGGNLGTPLLPLCRQMKETDFVNISWIDRAVFVFQKDAAGFGGFRLNGFCQDILLFKKKLKLVSYFICRPVPFLQGRKRGYEDVRIMTDIFKML